MLIAQIEEVYQALHRNGDVEFDYKGTPYMIEAWGIPASRQTLMGGDVKEILIKMRLLLV